MPRVFTSHIWSPCITTSPVVAAARAFYHVDMDGLDAIFKASSKTWPGGPDRFYTSAVDASLAFFDAQRVRATYFVIVQDLDDPLKRAASTRWCGPVTGSPRTR